MLSFQKSVQSTQTFRNNSDIKNTSGSACDRKSGREPLLTHTLLKSSCKFFWDNSAARHWHTDTQLEKPNKIHYATLHWKGDNEKYSQEWQYTLVVIWYASLEVSFGTLWGYLCRFNSAGVDRGKLEFDNGFRFQYQIWRSMPVHGFMSSLVPSSLICRQRLVLRCRNVLSWKIHTTQLSSTTTTSFVQWRYFSADALVWLLPPMENCWGLTQYDFQMATSKLDKAFLLPKNAEIQVEFNHKCQH